MMIAAPALLGRAIQLVDVLGKELRLLGSGVKILGRGHASLLPLNSTDAAALLRASALLTAG